MTASAFNSKYSSSVAGFRPISLSRQVGSPAPAPAAPAPAPAAAPAPAQDPWQTKVASLYGNVENFDSTAKNPLDMYNAALDSLGIGDARTRVTGLRESLLNTENLLRNVEGDVAGRTQESLVTENQKRRLVAMEQQPLAQQADIQGRNLEVALADYKDIMAEGKAKTEMEYEYQRDRRANMMSLLEVAIGEAKTAEDKRRWEAEYNRLVQKDREEAERWAKEFDLKQKEFALSASRGSGGGGGGGGGTSSADKAAYDRARNETISFLDKYKGGDGRVSPKTYGDARRAWTAKGQDPALFDSLFSGWANPSHIDDYI
jgi:hypothetical protein